MAAQLAAAPPAGEAWVIEALREGAIEALDRGAPVVAIGYLRRALAEPPPAEARGRLLNALGSAEVVYGDPAGIEHMREALAAAPPGRPYAEAASMFGYGLVAANLWQEAVDVFERGAAQLGPEDEDLALQMEATAATAGRLYRPTRAHTSRRLPALRRRAAGAPGGRGACMVAANLAFQRAIEGGTAAESRALLDEALAGGRLASDPYSPPMSDALYVTVISDDPRAEGHCDELIARNLRQGVLLAVAAVSCFRSQLALRSGAIALAESDARAALAVASEGGMRSAVALAGAGLAGALVERGELAEADRTVREAGGAGELPESFLDGFLLEARGRLRIELGELEAGVADLEELHRRERGWRRDNPGAMPYRSAMAFGLARLGEPARALALVEEELELARHWGTLWAIGIALRARGLLGPGDGTADLRAAAEALAPSRARLEHARALVDLGAVLRRSGQRVEARAHLRQGLAQAAACGAAALEERASQELRAAGGRPQRAHGHGLTPSERRIAAMAAEGLSNRDIAQSLFLSLKTVEMHLSSVYRKLDLRSRAQLASALAARPGR